MDGPKISAHIFVYVVNLIFLDRYIYIYYIHIFCIYTYLCVCFYGLFFLWF